MCNKKQIADNADMVVNGYAFTRTDSNYRVLNLNRDNRACVVSNSGEIIETSMDDIELSIVKYPKIVDMLNAKIRNEA